MSDSLRKVLMIVVSFFVAVAVFMTVHSYFDHSPDSQLVALTVAGVVVSAVLAPRSFASMMLHSIRYLADYAEEISQDWLERLGATGRRQTMIVDDLPIRSRVIVEIQGYDNLDDRYLHAILHTAASDLAEGLSTEMVAQQQRNDSVLKESSSVSA